MTILDRWKQARERDRAMAARAGQWSANSQPGGVRLVNNPGGQALRNYMAASTDRLVSDLQGYVSYASGNAEVRNSLRVMRARSRQLARDNEYAKRFLQLLRNNVVGAHGFSLQMKVYRSRGGKLDDLANVEIEDAYADMSRVNHFTASGHMSRAAFERSIIHHLACDGEVIIEKLVGRFNRFGICWRLIDPDLLDETLNVKSGGAQAGVGQLTDGAEIRMGVERNKYGKPVAYWFRTGHPGDDLSSVNATQRRRVPADRIIHRFLSEELRADTVRGVPWLYAAMRRVGMLAGYEEAVLVGARTGAAQMGFFVPPDKEGGGVLADGEALASSRDAAGNLYTEAEPATFGVLPAGWDFKTFDPAYPNDKMEAFCKHMLRAFSVGVGVDYNTLAGDMEGVSLSTMRHSANTNRDFYEGLQQWMREHVCEPMFSEWLLLALSMGQVGKLALDGLERYNKPRFNSRPWRSPDPQKDVAASAQAVSLGISSRTRICAERGEDFEEILRELAEEENLARELGVTLNAEAASAHKTPAVDDAGKPVPVGAESTTEPNDGGEDGSSDAGTEDQD